MTSTTAVYDATAQAILDASLRVIRDKGVKGATTRLIAQAADVNEVTLFRKFGTKNNLINQAIADRFATLQDDAVLYTGDLEADLIRLVGSYHDTMVAFGPVARVLMTEVPFDPDLAPSRDAAAQLFAAFTGMLHRYQQEGVLRPEPGESLVPAFLGPIALPIILGGFPIGSNPDIPPLDAAAYVNRFLYGRIGK